MKLCHTKSHSILLMLLILLISAPAMVGCGPVDTEDAIRHAEDELSVGNLEQAASSCDMLSDSSIDLSPTQLCRLAIIYAKISERSEKEDYMASAAQCYNRAISLGCDSIDSYIESLRVEDRSYLHLIKEVTDAMHTPVDCSHDDDDYYLHADSLSVITSSDHDVALSEIF